MKGDFSRDSFDPQRRVGRVLMQQGRPVTDADWNEQADVVLHNLRTVVADFAGPVAPIGGAFAISSTRDGDLAIAPGHIYVDGILCVNDEPTTYLGQPHLPVEHAPSALGPVLVYLDVWDRHVTEVELPEIREPALGGADTATRSVVVWQVRLHELDAGADCDLVRNQWEHMVDLWQPAHRGRLVARTEAPVEGDAAHAAPLDLPYRGHENRLYRVEVHTGGPAGVATFVWSRANGSVVLPLAGDVRESRAAVETLGVAEHHSVGVGDWVEIVDDRDVLRGVPGVLAEVVQVDRIEGSVRLDLHGRAVPTFAELDTHPMLRRWDHRHRVDDVATPGPDGALQIEEGVAIPLEDGLEVEFEPANDGAAHRYRTGDYWLVPARATGDVLWPRDGAGPAAMAPRGVPHHYAPLAVVAADGTVVDCLAELRR